MRNKPSKPDNPTLSLAIRGLGFLVFLGYWACFLAQPSTFGFQDEDGNTLDRLTDLLIMPALIPGIFGDGIQPLGLLDRVPLLCGVLAWIGLSGWLGTPLVRWSIRSSNRLLEAALAILAGLALLSTTTFILGWMGGLSSRWPLSIVLAVQAFIAWQVRQRQRLVEVEPVEACQQPVEDLWQPHSLGGLWLTRLIPIATSLLAASYLLGSLLPPWEFDVVEYHLQGPKEFWQAGRIDFAGHNVYVNMPLGAEMHALAAMVLIGGSHGWWWGGLLGKAVIGTYGLLAAAVAGGWMAEKFGKTCGWAVAGLLLAAPGNTHVSMAGLIDMAVGAYILAMWVVIDRFDSESLQGQGRGSGVVFLGSWFAGAAAACKYPGLLFAVVPMFLVVLISAVRHPGSELPSRAAFRRMAWFALALGLTCTPWLAKNAVTTSNPVYPLAFSTFGGRGLTEASAQRWNRVHRPQADGDSSAYSASALWKSSKQLVLSSPLVNPSFYFLAILGVVVSFWRRELPNWFRVGIGLLGWILVVWWLATHRIDRFWLPALPILAALAAVGSAWIVRQWSATWASSIVCCGLAYGLLQALSGATPNDNRFFVALSALQRETVAETTAGDWSPAAWVNSHLASTDRILAIGEAKAFHYRIPVVYATCFNEPPGRLGLTGQSPSEQWKYLTDENITHVMVDWSEIARYRSPGNYGFSSWPTRTDLEAMVQAGILQRMVTPFDPQALEILTVSDRPPSADAPPLQTP